MIVCSLTLGVQGQVAGVRFFFRKQQNLSVSFRTCAAHSGISTFPLEDHCYLILAYNSQMALTYLPVLDSNDVIVLLAASVIR